MQFDQLEILSYMHQPETVSSNTCSQMYVQIKHSLAHLQDLIPTLAGRRYANQKHLGCKNGEANQKQQLSGYEYIAIFATKSYDIS